MSDTKPTILAIDDAEGVRRLLEVTLGKSQVVKTAPDAHSALAWAQLATPPDLVLLDTEPAGMSGYELCKALRAMPGFTEVPVVFLAERRDPPDVVQGFQLGAIDFLVKPLAAPLLLQRVRGHLEQLARERTAGTQGAELRIGRLARAMQLYERSLGGNRAKRLAQYARALAQAAGARESAAELLAKAAPVHDVGKLAVPPELLHNERALAGAEREQFERHAALGAEIIGEHEDALLKLARTLALTHHEFWDGSGYPGRLQGNQIPSAGRVMAIVDAFESMTAAQFGGSRMSTEAAVAEIVAGAGLQFDPALVDALRKAAAEFRKVHGAYPERAADAGEDLVIGAPSARLPAAKREQPAAQADDLVLGAPARDPTDDAGLTMMGPLRLGGGAAASSDKIREAIQRAAAKAQRPAAPPPPPEAPPTVQEKPAAVPLDLQLEALRARVSELEAERTAAHAAVAQARGELDALNARINSHSQTEMQLQEARGEAQIRMNELEATRGALSEARAELERARSQPATSQAPVEPARPHEELEALNARVATLVSERTAAEAALAQAGAELQQARAETTSVRASARQVESELVRMQTELAEVRSKPVVAEREQSQAELEGLRGRIKEVESELQRARTSAKELEGLRNRARELESERAAVAAVLSEASAERERSRAELEGLRGRINELESELQRAHTSAKELEGLRARMNDLQLERAAADAAHARGNAETADAEARLAEIQAALGELQRRREDAEATLTALQARVVDAEEQLEAQTERVRIAAGETPAAPAPAEMVSVPAAPRPIATQLVVAFLFGALAMGVAYLLLHP